MDAACSSFTLALSLPYKATLDRLIGKKLKDVPDA